MFKQVLLSWEYLDWEYFWGVLYFSSTSCKYNTATLNYTARIVIPIVVLGGTLPARVEGAMSRKQPGAGGGSRSGRVRQQGHDEANGLDCTAAGPRTSGDGTAARARGAVATGKASSGRWGRKLAATWVPAYSLQPGPRSSARGGRGKKRLAASTRKLDI